MRVEWKRVVPVACHPVAAVQRSRRVARHERVVALLRPQVAEPYPKMVVPRVRPCWSRVPPVRVVVFARLLKKKVEARSRASYARVVPFDVDPRVEETLYRRSFARFRPPLRHLAPP